MHYIGKSLIFLYKNKKKIIKLAAISFGAGLFFIVLIFVFYLKDLPSPDNIADIYIPESTKIYDRTERVVLYDIYQTTKSTPIDFENIPQHMREATIVAEDDNFYHHIGIDFKAIMRALFMNIKGGGISEGGSTITQQFIKNAFLTPERTITRKIKELILSLELELRYSKDEILGFYLNSAPYGSNTSGVEMAAKIYFDKHAQDITIAEAAILAALPKAPTYYGNNAEKLAERQRYILDRMFSFGYITEEEYKSAISEQISFQTTYTGMQAPHFVIEIKKYLEAKYGAAFVAGAGLKVITTLDPIIQAIAEEVVKERGEFNEKNFNATNAALIALDPHTGQILAMVGSRDYFNIEAEGNVNVTLRPRQPGSSFKPFAYSVALQKGYTLDTILYDVPTEFNPNCDWGASQETDEFGLACYNPQNYDSLFLGPITLKEALAQSRNLPSVKILYLAGIQETIDFAKSLGIESLGDASNYGLSLVLGGGEVTLLEETSAYGVFAAQGEKNTPVNIIRIEDRMGNILEEYKYNPSSVISENIVNQINYILSDNNLRAPVFGEQNYLNIPGLAVAAKTGTTQEYRDAWTVGYTPSLAVGVWVGNNRNEKMRDASGAAAAAPIWHDFITRVYAEKKEESDEIINSPFYFKLPSLEEESSFSDISTPPTGKSVLDGQIMAHSILKFISRENPLDAEPENPSIDPQYQNWENAVLFWITQNTSNDDSLLNNEQGSISATDIIYLEDGGYFFIQD